MPGISENHTLWVLTAYEACMSRDGAGHWGRGVEHSRWRLLTSTWPSTCSWTHCTILRPQSKSSAKTLQTRSWQQEKSILLTSNTNELLIRLIGFLYKSNHFPFYGIISKSHCKLQCIALWVKPWKKPENKKKTPWLPFFGDSYISDKNIWNQFHFSLIFGYELKSISAAVEFSQESVAIQGGRGKDVNKIGGTSWM